MKRMRYVEVRSRQLRWVWRGRCKKTGEKNKKSCFVITPMAPPRTFWYRKTSWSCKSKNIGYLWWFQEELWCSENNCRTVSPQLRVPQQSKTLHYCRAKLTCALESRWEVVRSIDKHSGSWLSQSQQYYRSLHWHGLRLRSRSKRSSYGQWWKDEWLGVISWMTGSVANSCISQRNGSRVMERSSSEFRISIFKHGRPP